MPTVELVAGIPTAACLHVIRGVPFLPRNCRLGMNSYKDEKKKKKVEA